MILKESVTGLLTSGDDDYVGTECLAMRKALCRVPRQRSRGSLRLHGFDDDSGYWGLITGSLQLWNPCQAGSLLWVPSGNHSKLRMQVLPR